MGSFFRAGTALVALTVSPLVHAGDATLAEALFREGKSLMGAGDFQNACPKLEESFRQDPATGTLLALAMCQESDGKLASAWTSFNTVVARAQQEGRKDRVKAARAKIDALEPRLAKLTIIVPKERPAGLEVERDGTPLPEAAWGSATPVDPGEHSIDSSAPGYEPFRRVVAVTREGEQVSVAIPPLAPLPAPADPTATLETKPAASPGVPAPVSPPAQRPAPAPRHETETERGTSTLSWVGLGVGVAGVVSLGAGTYFGLQAKDRDKRSEQAGCSRATGLCPADGRGTELNQDALSSARVSTALFVAGGVLTVGGLVTYLLGRSSDVPSENGSVDLSVSAGVGSVTVRGRF